MAAGKPDWVVSITPPKLPMGTMQPNVRYLCGFHRIEGAALVLTKARLEDGDPNVFSDWLILPLASFVRADVYYVGPQ